MPDASLQPLPLGYSPLTQEEGRTDVLIVPAALVHSIEVDRRRKAVIALSAVAAAPRAQPPVPPEETPAQRPSPPGRQVPVITYRALAERRVSIDTRFRFSTEEKKAEMRAIDALIERGDMRVVGLSPQWRKQIGQMRSQMPHLEGVIDCVEACCALAEFTRRPLRIPPLLLVGPPGVGKTHFATAVAELLVGPTFVYALESAETVSALTGSDKHWSNSEPGQLFKLVMQGEFANLVIVLDELDKARDDGSGYLPANALHALLEPATSKQFRDKSVDLAFDASYVVYIATANRLSNIKASLLLRRELFLVDEPGPRAAITMARAIGKQVVADLNLTGRFAAPDGDVLHQLALIGSPRQMHKLVVAAIGRAIVQGRRRLLVEDLPTNCGERFIKELDHESFH